MIRPATPSDLAAVVAMGIEALEREPEPDLVLDRAHIARIAQACISGPSNFCWVSERDGQVVAAVSALVEDQALYERKMATVMQFYSKAPGEGIKLIRELLRWTKSRPIIKRVVFQLEVNADPRIAKMLRRMGLRSAGEVFTAAPREVLATEAKRKAA